jgi:hypothetical protein
VQHEIAVLVEEAQLFTELLSFGQTFRCDVQVSLYLLALCLVKARQQGQSFYLPLGWHVVGPLKQDVQLKHIEIMQAA